MKCYLCSSNKIKTIHKGCRDNDGVDVCECLDCGLVLLNTFDHIMDVFYKEGNMRNGKNKIDVSTWIEISQRGDLRRYENLKNRIKDKKVLDFGSGAGGFCKLVKKTTDKIYGLEPDEETKAIYKDFDITCFKNTDEISENLKFDFITSFHVFEHLPDPVSTLKELSNYLKEDGKIIIEYPSSNDALLSLYGSKSFANFTHWSCHLMLFNKKTSRMMVEKADLNVDIIKGVQRYPLSNHMYWLANDKPGGHEKWLFLNEKDINKMYEKILDEQDMCDTIWLEVSKNNGTKPK